jgi:hypothetical protein
MQHPAAARLRCRENRFCPMTPAWASAGRKPRWCASLLGPCAGVFVSTRQCELGFHYVVAPIVTSSGGIVDCARRSAITPLIAGARRVPRANCWSCDSRDTGAGSGFRYRSSWCGRRTGVLRPIRVPPGWTGSPSPTSSPITRCTGRPSPIRVFSSCHWRVSSTC